MNSLPWRGAVVFGCLFSLAGVARAADPPPGFLEPVIQWGVQKGETCEDIARAMYGSPAHAGLVLRYNRVDCTKGKPLPEGKTLILPEKVTAIPDAKLRSVNPDVRARPSGGAWTPAATGMPLFTNASVNSLRDGRADIEFIDHTRIFLASNTLVVIYGTAARTQVSKTPPPIIEVQEGELRAGIAALRGEGTIDVGVPGGGRVNAASRDAVVERKGERTTVAVFDGKADVSSAGKTVSVPKDHGTRFVGQAPPAPPRPLPPAPVWEPGGSEGVVLAPDGKGLIHVAWRPVPNALRYRFEVARDPGFHDLAVREEVSSEITAFRAENQPPGKYFLGVRAIDKEEYLGIASEVRAIEVIETRFTGARGAIDQRSIEANPYGVLELTPSPAVEMALDDGPFGAMIPAIDLARRAPAKVRLRARGGPAAQELTVRYTPVTAKIHGDRSGSSLSLTVTPSGLDGIDVAGKVAPRARVHLGDQVVEAKLAVGPGGAWSAAVPLAGALSSVPDRARIDVVDRNGRVLASDEVDLAPPAPPPAPPPAALPDAPEPRIGPTAPLRAISPALDVPWWSPTAPDALWVSGTVDAGGDRSAGQLAVQGSGRIGALGLDGALVTGVAGRPGPESAWLGGRYRVFRVAGAVCEGGLALRLGIPLDVAAPPPRVEGAIAFGGVRGRFTWLGNLGGRMRFEDDLARRNTPAVQGFLLAGGTFDLLPFLRPFAVLDAHLLYDDRASSFAGQGGLGLGLEAGTTLFGSAALRLSPWRDEAGLFSAQIAVGLRDVHP
ncbi:MAG: hypothetical protein U0359_12575 [Byssovorax sp.]